MLTYARSFFTISEMTRPSAFPANCLLAVPITFPIAYLCAMLTQKLGPTTEKERHLILDVLRGLA